MEYTVTATLTLVFDSDEGFVTSQEQAIEEMHEYLNSCPSASEFTITGK